ncbi:hypothetical protein EA58_11190 [Photobacterium galatheae]|uniref:Uncharacterized protein n=1 Tax=Photobacterium galatheae TaxID=1654360 RepID=A0A066RMB2_9GAMM|nr:hypothetical protein EA58_11190 [Photobacterium galatheae]
MDAVVLNTNSVLFAYKGEKRAGVSKLFEMRAVVRISLKTLREVINLSFRIFRMPVVKFNTT